MSNRATMRELRDTVNRYAQALTAYGVIPADKPASYVVGAPYGQTLYVFRYGAGHSPIHDVPGFDGTGGAGFVTIREGIDRVRQSIRTLHDVARLAGWQWNDPATVTDKAVTR